MLCRHPFLDRDSVIILGDHVTAEAGTGCVHTAPGHGAEDFEVCKKYDIEVSIELPEITEENSFDVLKGFMPILSGIGSAPGIGEEDYTYDIPALSDGINVVMNGK